MNIILKLFNSLANLIPILLIYLFILCIVFEVSLYFIFKKCYKKGYFAFIPFFNIYEYMDICHIHWCWGFVPIVNLVIFFVSPYLIGYQFGQKEFVKIMGMLFPIAFFPYIAFSKASYIHPKIQSLHIKNIEDIDNLERKVGLDIEIEKNNNSEISALNFESNKKKDIPKLESKKDILLDQLDKQYANLDYAIVDDVFQTKANIKEEIPTIYADSDFVELDDFNYESKVDSMSDINVIEKNAVINGLESANDNSEYKEIKEEEKTSEEIAFEQKKKGELVCPKCGSSLIGAINICPGCGMDLKLID